MHIKCVVACDCLIDFDVLLLFNVMYFHDVCQVSLSA